MSDQTNNQQKVKEAPSETRVLFEGEKYCVASIVNGGVPDGKLYVAERKALPSGEMGFGSIHLAEPVYCHDDYDRAYNVCESLAKHLDFRAMTPIRDEKGANEAIIRALRV